MDNAMGWGIVVSVVTLLVFWALVITVGYVFGFGAIIIPFLALVLYPFFKGINEGRK